MNYVVLLCSSIDWTAPIPTGSLSVPKSTRPQAVYSGFRGVPDQKKNKKKTGWVGRGEEQRRHFSPGSKAPAAAVATAAACLPVLQGGFLACQAWEASHTDGLEIRVYPLRPRTHVSCPGAVRRAPERLMKRTGFFPPHICDAIHQKEDFCIDNHSSVAFCNNLRICFSALSCDNFVRAVDIFSPAAFYLSATGKGESTNGFSELILVAAYLNLLRFFS